MNPKLPLHLWDISQTGPIKQVHTGLLNQTYIFTVKGNIFVLQKLHTAVALPGAAKNYFQVTEFLHKKKFPTQRVVKTTTGKLWAKNTGAYWRLLRGVPGKVYTSTKSPRLGFEAGKILADFHRNLRDYRGPVHKTLPMFQYQTVFRKLKKYKPQLLRLKDEPLREATLLLMREFPKNFLPKFLPKQIIHTDPKISNFIFDSRGRGVCMIDLDTIQKLSPLYDIGDAVRSMCGQEEDDPNSKFNRKMYEQFVNGYKNNNQLNKREYALIPQACCLVMLGLAARFLNDYVDDDYFGWDPKRYKNRRAHNRARVLGQLSLYKSFVKSLQNNL
jgi:Ser/Thr protein kinase RdoA (MazF antagonist)